MHIYTPIIPSLPLVPMAGVSNTAAHRPSEEESELRRGPWTVEEDTLLIHYIAAHGEGQWNLLAKQAGLKRTGKSCRLRWLNYLKPDIKRGNLTLQEQLLILELHSKWGNRWSKIAQQLPGRTDNEIKNYWRTRVQKQLRQLKVQAHSRKLLDAICHLSMLEAMDQTSNYSINLPPSLHNMNLPNSSNSTVLLPANHSSGAPPPPPPRSVQQWPEISAWPPSPCGEFMEAWRFDMVEQKQLHEPVGALGDWEVGDRDAQMIAPDWVLEDAMVENLWSLDHHLI